jgi:predicted dehydrogenase
MKKLEHVNWGILGVGDVTEVKSGPAFYKVEHSTVAAVMRRSAEKASDYARRHGIAKSYSDGADLINDPDVNAVYIATPPNSHAEYAIAAMRAGKPVYVEKPMARTHAECEEMLQVSRETGMPLWVAYYRRALPAFLEAKRLIEAGEIGQPLSVRVTLHWPAKERRLPQEEMNWRVKPEIGGAGHFFDLASHQFDYLDFALGKIIDVQGIAANLAGLYTAEDTVSASWQHSSGVVGSGNWSFAADAGPEEDSIEISGDKGAIQLSCFEAPDILVFRTNTRKDEQMFVNPENISRLLVQQVVNELRGAGKCVSTGESAARTNRVMEEIIRKYYSYKS